MTHSVSLAWSRCIKLSFLNTKDSSSLEKRDWAGWRGRAFYWLDSFLPPRTKDKICWINLKVVCLQHRKTLNYFSKLNPRFSHILPQHFLLSLGFVLKLRDVSQSRASPMIEKGWWERLPQFLELDFSSPLLTPSTHDYDEPGSDQGDI